MAARMALLLHRSLPLVPVHPLVPRVGRPPAGADRRGPAAQDHPARGRSPIEWSIAVSAEDGAIELGIAHHLVLVMPCPTTRARHQALGLFRRRRGLANAAQQKATAIVK